MSRGRTVLTLVLFEFAAACANEERIAAPPIAHAQTMHIQSLPAGAFVAVESGASCTTPCALKVKPSDPVRVTLHKDGCLTETQSVMTTEQYERAGDAAYVLAQNPFVAQLICDGAPGPTTHSN